MIDYINIKDAAIIIVDSFWIKSLNRRIQNMALKRRWDFIDISYLSLDSKNSALNFANHEVKKHPGDLGMQKIANSIMAKFE